MSMRFDEPVSDEVIKKITKAFGEPVAHDRQTFIFDKLTEVRQSEMKEIANTAKQVTTVELNAVGEIKTMSDGTRYEVTPRGWRKLETV